MEDEDFMEIMASAATVIIVTKRNVRQRNVWSRQWLTDRSTDRGMLNFVDYEIRDGM
jgi:hypothetical protein